MDRRRKFWGWGLEDEQPPAARSRPLGGRLRASTWGSRRRRRRSRPGWRTWTCRPPRMVPPGSLAHIFSTDPYDRAAHTYGRSFRDLVRAFRPGLRARAVISWPSPAARTSWSRCSTGAATPARRRSRSAAAPAWSAASSRDVGDGYRGAVSVDLRHPTGCWRSTGLAGRADRGRHARARRWRRS